MNTDNGTVVRMTDEEIEKLGLRKGNWREINEKHLSERHRKALETSGRTKIHRNDPCPCGSGRKFKKCCRT